MFMAIIDTTIVNVALPTISRDLSVPLNRMDGLVVGYLVSLAAFIPASGWLGDRFGTRRVFLAALAIFTLASALCRLAQTFGELVGFRALQGAGGGMLTPTGMAMLYRALMFLLGLCQAQNLVPLQAAAFATITPADTGAPSTLFNTARQLGMAAGVAILTTVASAVGLTQHAAGRTTSHLAAYHAGLVTASVIALIAAGAAQFVDDRAAAATMRVPVRRGTPAAAAGSAGCHHPAATERRPSESRDAALPAPGQPMSS